MPKLLAIVTSMAVTTLSCIGALAKSPPEVMLFGDVSHSEQLPEATAALEAHRAKIAKLQYVPPPPVAPPISIQSPPMAPPISEPLWVPPAAYMPKDGGIVNVPQVGPEAPHRVLSSEIAEQHYTVEWFMIPRRMAGTWVKDGDLTTMTRNLRTGVSTPSQTWTENRLEAKWGHQIDGEGNVWHVNLLPSERDGSSAGKKVRFLTVAQRCERTNNLELVTRTHYLVSETDNWSGQQVDAFQQEALNHYAFDKDNQLVNNSQNRVFTYRGQPVRDGYLLSKHKKTRDFVPVDVLGGIDLRASLNDYLQSRP